MPERIMGIYTIRNTTTGRIYVGSSSDVETRWDRHRGDLFRGQSVNAALLRDWREHGAAAFTFAVVEVIAEATDSLPLVEAELRWIDRYRAEGAELYNRARPFPYPLAGHVASGATRYETLLLEADDPNLLSERQAAQRWGVSFQTVRNWAVAGRLPAWRAPDGALRFDPAVLDQMIADMRSDAREEVPMRWAPDGFVDVSGVMFAFTQAGLHKNTERLLREGLLTVHRFPDYGQGRWRFVAIAELEAFIAAERERAT